MRNQSSNKSLPENDPWTAEEHCVKNSPPFFENGHISSPWCFWGTEFVHTSGEMIEFCHCSRPLKAKRRGWGRGSGVQLVGWWSTLFRSLTHEAMSDEKWEKKHVDHEKWGVSFFFVRSGWWFGGMCFLCSPRLRWKDEGWKEKMFKILQRPSKAARKRRGESPLFQNKSRLVNYAHTVRSLPSKMCVPGCSTTLGRAYQAPCMSYAEMFAPVKLVKPNTASQELFVRLGGYIEHVSNQSRYPPLILSQRIGVNFPDSAGW